MRVFYHIIRRLSSTLSCNKTLVINFFLFHSLFQANLPGLTELLSLHVVWAYHASFSVPKKGKKEDILRFKSS